MARPARAANPAPPRPQVITSSDRASVAIGLGVILAALPLKMLVMGWSYMWLTIPLVALLSMASLVGPV